jgi:hypothetical protein
MYDNTLAALTERLTLLERRWRWYRLLAIGGAMLVLLMVGVAAQTTPTPLEVLRVAGLDIVDEQGRVLIHLGPHPDGSTIQVRNGAGSLGVVLYASTKGGRLEVLNAEAREVFSAGLSSEHDVPGVWERHLRVFDQQQQDITRQRQDIDRMTRESRDTGDVSRLAALLEQQRRDVDRLGHDIESQRRDIDAQRRELGSLERQVRSLERR